MIMRERWVRAVVSAVLAAGLLAGVSGCDLFRSSAGGQGHRTTIPAPGESDADDELYPVTVSPSSGPPGTHVTITGHGFTGSVAICVGTQAASGIHVISGTRLTAIVPPGNAAGTVQLYVESRNGTAGDGRFAYTSSGLAGARAAGCGKSARPGSGRP